jgi:hypothetical protein
MPKAIHVLNNRIVARCGRIDNPTNKMPSQRLRAATRMKDNLIL